MFLKIFALVKVIDEFDLKILANLVNILNHDDTNVRALRARASREREIFSRVCFLAFKQRKATFKTPRQNNTKIWAAYGEVRPGLYGVL